MIYNDSSRYYTVNNLYHDNYTNKYIYQVDVVITTSLLSSLK